MVRRFRDFRTLLCDPKAQMASIFQLTFQLFCVMMNWKPMYSDWVKFRWFFDTRNISIKFAISIIFSYNYKGYCFQHCRTERPLWCAKENGKTPWILRWTKSNDSWESITTCRLINIRALDHTWLTMVLSYGWSEALYFKFWSNTTVYTID